MTYDFDRAVDRHNTNSIKYDFAVEFGLPADVLPLWVADMDFPAPPAVQEALRKAVDHGIFGYSDVKGDYAEAVINWFRTRHNWEPKAEWLVKAPGVVYALATAVRAMTEPGDRVLVTPPVYYPFFSVVRNNGREIVESPLQYENGKYTIDFEDFEKKIEENNVKMFILCSPHNPIGRVWTLDELRRIGDICRRHNVFVVADEIHCDFTHPGHPHTVFLNAVPEMAEQVIVCTAPSKSFNLAGLQASNIWIPGEQARNAFKQVMQANGYGQLNTMGLVACKAAYEGGAEWLDQCRDYMRENLNFVRAYLAENIPQIRLVEPEGTYFAWLDCSGLGLGKDELEDLVINKARLWLDGGHIFGGNGEQFQRVVLACTRDTLKQALDRLKAAVNG